MGSKGVKDEPNAALSVGRALRARRSAEGISVRALASQVGVSASLISQIETGKVNPSVGTLVALTTALDLSLDELFLEEEQVGAQGQDSGVVVREGERAEIALATGVRWHRLTPSHEEGVDFLYVIYEVGGASCPPDALMRHRGREYGLLLSGRLGATIGFDSHELGPGDSIVFNADTPHRLWAIGDEPATAVWTIIGRDGDHRETFGA